MAGAVLTRTTTATPPASQAQRGMPRMGSLTESSRSFRGSALLMFAAVRLFTSAWLGALLTAFWPTVRVFPAWLSTPAAFAAWTAWAARSV